MVAPPVPVQVASSVNTAVFQPERSGEQTLTNPYAEQTRMEHHTRRYKQHIPNYVSGHCSTELHHPHLMTNFWHLCFICNMVVFAIACYGLRSYPFPFIVYL